MGGALQRPLRTALRHMEAVLSGRLSLRLVTRTDTTAQSKSLYSEQAYLTS